jgi:hypothetical protein
MALTAAELGAEKARSYKVRDQITGGQNRDWSWAGSGRAMVTVRARRATPNVAAGEVVQLVSTSNAGFAGVTGLAWRDGGYVQLGSLGNYDVEETA